MSTPDVLPAATRRPQPHVPARFPSSIRRSSHIGVQLPDEPADRRSSDLVVHGAVRDVVTDAHGHGDVVGAASLDCAVAGDRRVSSIGVEPDEPRLTALVGQVAHRGWRALVHQIVGTDSPLSSLLDDVPIALLLSSYGELRRGALNMTAVQPLMLHMRNLCAGWAEGATPMRTMAAGLPMPLPGVVPVPAAPRLDPLATEPSVPLAPGEVRRTRRLDVLPGEQVVVHADFRDAWCNLAGEVGALHEYVVTAALSADGTVLSIEADPRVLPYAECSFAAESPRRLVGRRIDDVAAEVRATAGTSTCSHLDDLLRTLVTVPALLRTFEATAGED